MTPSDRTELREMLKEHVAGIIAIQEAKDIGFKYQIDNIENMVIEIKAQTTKTNGRVNELEKKTVAASSVRNFIIVASSVIAAFGAVLVGIMEFFIKKT